LNEDNTYSLHVNALLQKHFVVHSAAVTELHSGREKHTYSQA
jgi:hypothetical protein